MKTNLVPRAIRYVEEVARLGSIQAAARELGISASAIDRQIMMVEADTGVPLFERHAGGMRVNPSGELVVALARRWRGDLERLWSDIKHLQGANFGHVRLAAMDSHANGLLPSLISALARSLPGVILDVEIVSTDSAIEALRAGTVELAVAFNARAQRDIEVLWSAELPLGCVVAPNHPLAARSGVTFKEIAVYPIASQSRSLMIRRYLENKHGWLLSGAKPPIVTNSLQLVKCLAKAGNHIAISSELDMAPELLENELVFVPISDAGAKPQNVSVIASTRHGLPNIARMVAQMLIEVIEGSLSRARTRPASRVV